MTTERGSREAWLSSLLSFARREGELHPYGSPEWCALPDRSWRKIAAACQYGEFYFLEGENLPTRLFDEHWATLEVEERLAAEHTALVRAYANVSPLLHRPGYIPRRAS